MKRIGQLSLMGMLVIAFLAGCSGREATLADATVDQQIERYDIVLTGLPDKPMEDLAEESLQTFLQRDKGVPSSPFLRRRAESDLPVMRRILAASGYLTPEIGIEISPATEDTPLSVTFDVKPGPVFILDRHALLLVEQEGDPPPLDTASFGSPVGKPAIAARIVGAEDAIVGALRREGFAYARFLGRQAEAVRADATLEVTSTIAVGRKYRFGDVTFDGVKSVEEPYLRTYIPWTDNSLFNLASLRDYQTRLSQTELFTSVTVTPPESPPQGDTVPITVRVEERKPRTIAASLRFDTRDGPEVSTSLTHRNLFGANERGTATIEAGLRRQSFEISFVKPQYRRDGQRLLADLELRRVQDDAFDELGGTLFAGVERDVTDQWTIGAGGLIEVARVRDAGVTRDVLLAGVPLKATFDSRDDPLDATKGRFLTADLIPLGGQIDRRTVGFVILDSSASTYHKLDADGRYVLAARARLANIFADTLSTVPAQRRLYSGGGGSVRGFALDAIGPRDAANDPTGGLSAVEVGAELRARIFGDIGGVVFVEGGAVSQDMFLADAPPMRFGAGLGLRYYSPVGPIRLDVAAPINRQRGDDLLQFYLSIGQAF